ncbi:P-loop containing nucleoside triphosphate hydrolase protein [Rhizoctonia solani]|uniref:P-loop containing nucleoside triphosphate hydrolase protein n=1 Tax=Rhizoctonia solani TaxID=456999 RepID=A0A8H7H5S5_9AGAM|nr:P-loop containing nucleoside triphosphate hydrolase protein [Rhizoctonia solani]
MAGSMSSALPTSALSPPTLLRLYTLCVVVSTASLAIWGPQLVSSVLDLTRPGTTPEPEPESSEEQPAEEKPAEDKDKKWKRKTQIWQDAEPPEAREKDKGLVFVAIKRYGGNSGREDHIWIEINSQPLTELLRSEFKHLEGLLDDDPGMDARELYMSRERLAELAATAPPEEETQPEGNADGDESKDSADTEPANNATSKEASEGVAELTGQTESTKNNNASDEPALAGFELSKADRDQGLRDVKLIYDFIMDEFQKVDEKLNKLAVEGMISWKLLWAFIRRGQRLETSHSTTGEKQGFIMTSWDYDTDRDGKPVFVINGRWLEWTGYRYTEQEITRRIPEFAGLKKAADLRVRHLSKESFEELMSRGRTYAKYAGIHHLNYTSNIILDDKKLRAEGRLMVDVASYRRMNPNYDRWEYDDPRHFSSRRARDNMASSRVTLADDDEDLIILPPTLYGYSFIAKVWGEILVEHLSPVPFQPQIFDHLVLRNDYKNMIRSLVDAHAGKGESALLTDVVTGKGGGLVIVLHGKPGIGKTLTAEAISEHLERPLYIVSSGELGVNASYLETSLKDTLEVATIWKAVTLIDEYLHHTQADVFLEARSSHELERNALVSVFLRVLEYHSGVLILTTNRIRAFDEAFLSRFSIALRYPELDQNSRKVLWAKFLSMAGASVEGHKSKAITNGGGIETPHNFSIVDIEKLSTWNLNGRVIKQSARTAQALAVSAGESLGMSHVETVLKVSDQFAEDWKELTIVDTNPRSGSS